MMRSRTARLLPLPLLLLPLLVMACPPDATEGEGDASEGEGDVVAEGEGDANEGEGDANEGEGDVVAGEGEGEPGVAGLGAACVDNAGCGSGFCVDGVCCDVICDGGCVACSAALTGAINGACAPISDGLDPDDECADEEGSCGSGSCDGDGACGFKADGAVCRDAADACDAVEFCFSGTCQNDAPAQAGTECRAADGACDVAEVCDGVARSCPTDGIAGTDVVCRGNAGACDVDEFCDGASTTCPADVVQNSGVLCRAPISDCDAAEVCDGLSGACPTDAFTPAGTETESCGAFVCTGASGACPITCTSDANCVTAGFCTTGGNTCVRGNLAFTTSTGTLGNMGGLAGADAICQNLGVAAGHTNRVFKAWLSDSTTSVLARFARSAQPYRLANGSILANNFADLTDGTIATPFNVTETGAIVPSNIPFTGTLATGGLVGGPAFSNTCSDWTSTAGFAVNGFSQSITSTWSSNSNSECLVLHRLYCFEQEPPG